MSTPYRRGYKPPFPQLMITLRTDEEQLAPVTALLDSGADVTYVPRQLLERIADWQGDQGTIRSHFGESKRVRLYLIDVQVSGWTLPGLYVAADEVGNEIILGRDVLNKLPLFLDGPEEQTDLLDDATVKRLRARREAQEPR